MSSISLSIQAFYVALSLRERIADESHAVARK